MSACSADFQSAVSPISNRQGLDLPHAPNSSTTVSGGRMTKEFQMTKSKGRPIVLFFGHSSFGLLSFPHCGIIRYSVFGLLSDFGFRISDFFRHSGFGF